MTTTADVITALTQYREAVTSLQNFRAETYPRGRLVRVESPRYHGLGIVNGDTDNPPDQLPVLLENGNTWWYPIEHCTPIRATKQMPRALRRIILRNAGINTL